MLDPSVDGDVVDLDPALSEESSTSRQGLLTWSGRRAGRGVALLALVAGQDVKADQGPTGVQLLAEEQPGVEVLAARLMRLLCDGARSALVTRFRYTPAALRPTPALNKIGRSTHSRKKELPVRTVSSTVLRRIAATGLLAVFLAGLLAALNVPSGGSTPAPRPHPVTPQIHTLPLAGVDGAARAAPRAGRPGATWSSRTCSRPRRARWTQATTALIHGPARSRCTADRPAACRCGSTW